MKGVEMDSILVWIMVVASWSMALFVITHSQAAHSFFMSNLAIIFMLVFFASVFALAVYLTGVFICMNQAWPCVPQ